MTSKVGTHIPPYPPIQPDPPIQPPPPVPLFIMFPFCAKETPVANRVTVPTAIASKVFINFPDRNDSTSGPLWQRALETERASRHPANPGYASQTPHAPSTPTAQDKRTSQSVPLKLIYVDTLPTFVRPRTRPCFDGALQIGEGAVAAAERFRP